MTEPIVIDLRFHGPPDSGNGGYTCGLVAARVDGPAEITLRRPPPLDTAFRVERIADGVRVLDGESVVAEGVQRSDDLGVDVPPALSVEQASAAGAGSRLRRHPAEHPFPTCFVCGPERAAGDGLRILVGPVVGRDVAADGWTPGPDLADVDGAVRPEFVWAALDCSGGVGALGDDLDHANPFVLGRLAATILLPVRAGAPHAVLGWRIGHEGRKVAAGSAIFSETGRLAGLARATWIRLA